jgi:hypothetical protein
MARTSTNVDFESRMNDVFPNNQNASAKGSKSVLQDFQLVLQELNSQMANGLQAGQTQFVHTYNCRESHESRMSILESLHHRMRGSAKDRHDELVSETETAIQQFEQTRKALINAKRIRNTMINRLRKQRRHLRILSTIPDDIKNTAGESLYNGHPIHVRLADSAAKDMIQQLKENYTHSARLLTSQHKWNYSVINYLLIQLQDNIDFQLTTLTQNAAKCREEDAEALKMALYEFSVEILHRDSGMVGTVHVEKHPKGYLLTFCSIYGDIMHESIIKNFSVETHITDESRSEFEIAQEMIKHGMFYRYGEANNDDDDDERHDNTWLLNDRESWIRTPPIQEGEEDRDCYDEDDDQAVHNQIMASSAVEDDDITTGHTPKAKITGNHGQAREKHSPHNMRKHKSKKTGFKPFQLCENTNHTTGSLAAEDCVSKLTHDAFKQHVSKQICKEVSKRARSGVKRSGSCDKEVCQRWNKKHASKKTLSQIAISAGYE